MHYSVYTAYTPAGKHDDETDDDDDDVPLVPPAASTGASFSVGMLFDASDRDDARTWMLRRFSTAHGGRCVCRNSGAAYVYCKCLICKASCAAAHCNVQQWRVSVMNGANLPCVPPAPPPPTEVVPVAVPVNASPCVLCAELCTTSVTCSKGHAIGVSCEDQCFENYVQSFISGDSLPTFINIGCIVRCPGCFADNITTPLDMQTEASKLTKEGFAKYVKAAAEPELLAAVQAAVQETKANMASSDKVISTLAAIFQPESCPKCENAFEHHGGCTSIPCPNCKTIFCMWCRTAFRTTGEGHSHAWDCQKAPLKEQMITDSPVFPAGHDENVANEFIHAFFKVRKLEMLQCQLQQGACSVLHAQSHTLNNSIYRMVISGLQTTSHK
jgi:hypothetical protein